MNKPEELHIKINDRGPTKEDPFGQKAFEATITLGSHTVRIVNLSSHADAIGEVGRILIEMRKGAEA